MQRLSAWFYLKNNKKRAAILILSFGLYFVLLYGVQFFLHPSVYMYEVIAVKGAERMQIGYLNGLEKLNDAMDLGMDMSLWEPEQEATYEEKVLMALRDYEPSVITRFILDVAVAFNRFYHNCRILSETDERVKQTRIALTLATKHVLGSAFEMICLKKTEKI